MVFLRRCTAGILVLTLSLVAAAASAQEPSAREEIPLERCDRLPVVRVGIDGEEMRFLVDTAATSMLNLKSFSQRKSKEIRTAVTSWSGTAAIGAREVTLEELALGSYRLSDVKLPAIDLSAIGKACGGRIDGILGLDLLERMGVSIDLKRRVAVLPPKDKDARKNEEMEAFDTFHNACVDAANRADLKRLENCFHPDASLFTPWDEVHGRQRVMDYLRNRYFTVEPPARFEFRDRDVHLLGDIAWFGYNYTITLPDRHIEARGTVTFRKTEGRWQIVIMHNSLVQKEDFQQP